MSPLPKQMIDRWRDNYGGADPGHGTLYWHVLMGGDQQLRNAARTAQTPISTFSGLHMTPLEWLHLTVLVAGSAIQISPAARSEMLAAARSSLSGSGPISIELSRIFYHPEAIVLLADPGEALGPIREAAQQATETVMGHRGTDAPSSSPWTPHVTLCYSTSTQPAEPIIAALGKRLPSCRVSVNTLSLVLQQGAEWLWNWSQVGAVSLPSSPPVRLPGKRGTRRTLPAIPWRRRVRA